VDLYLIPHAVYAIRIGTGKSVHSGAVLGVNHEYAAYGSLAVISNECARSHNVDIVVHGVIEMNAVGAIEFGPCGQHVRLVDGVNDEEHSRSPGWFLSVGPIRVALLIKFFSEPDLGKDFWCSGDFDVHKDWRHSGRLVLAVRNVQDARP
jgi:hypothetical protein